MNIIHCTPNMETSDPRIARARDTWKTLYSDFGWIPAHIPHPYPRSSKDIGDPRACCYLRDVFDYALSKATIGDTIVYTDDDIILTPGIDAVVRERCDLWPLFTGQRVEVNSIDEAFNCTNPQSEHVGRSMIGFSNLLSVTSVWELDLIPDFILGSCEADLCLAAMARFAVGSNWSMETASIPDPLCELPLGTIFHERHPSTWTGPECAPANNYNKKLAAAWFRENMPESIPIHLKDL